MNPLPWKMSSLRDEGLRPAALRFCAWCLLAGTPAGLRSDRFVSILRFIQAHGRMPDRKRRLYNDYLHGLKVSGALEEPLRVLVTDKEHAKLFVSAAVGSSYVVPTSAILRSEREIREHAFPADCVIKGTHGSGQYILRRNGEPIDRDVIVGWLSYNHYRHTAERNYRTLVPKIIVEPIAEFGGNITELYIHCYRGEPRVIRVIRNRLTDRQLNVFDPDWREAGVAYYGANSREDIPRPRNLPEILRVARKIASHFESIRVDMYVMGDRFWVGELTNCQSGALLSFDSPDGEERFSELYFGSAEGA